MDVSEARRFKDLEEENRQLEAAVSDLTLREEALKEAPCKEHRDARGPVQGGPILPGQPPGQRRRRLAIGGLQSPVVSAHRLTRGSELPLA